MSFVNLQREIIYIKVGNFNGVMIGKRVGEGKGRMYVWAWVWDIDQNIDCLKK